MNFQTLYRNFQKNTPPTFERQKLRSSSTPMKMANTEKKGGFFARFRKNKTAEFSGENPKASPAASEQSKSTTSPPSPAKPAPAAEVSTQHRDDVSEPVNPGTLVESLFKTMLNLSIAYLKMVDNTLKVVSENLDKSAKDRKGQ